MKRIISLIIAVFFLGGAASAQVSLLCSPSNDWCEQLGPHFKEATGIDLNYIRMSTSEGLARLRAEEDNPTFDVWFGGTGDPHLVAFNEGITTFYKPTVWDDLLDDLKKSVGETYIPLYSGPLAFVINEGVLAEEGLEAPKCWEDLRDPKYKGLIAMPNPNTSGTAYTIIATLIQIFGEEEAFDILRDMHHNIAQYTKSGGAVGLLAGRGDIAVAVQFLGDGVRYKVQGFPVTNVVPCEGTGFEIGGISLVTNAPHKEDAIAFIEWALTPKAQLIAAEKAMSYQLQSNRNTPAPKEMPDPSTINLIDYDFEKYGSPDIRNAIVDRWTNEIFPIPR